VVTTIHKITHEYVVAVIVAKTVTFCCGCIAVGVAGVSVATTVCYLTAHSEQLQQVEKLTMNVTTDGNRTAD
jgi:hypothetical protein